MTDPVVLEKVAGALAVYLFSPHKGRYAARAAIEAYLEAAKPKAGWKFVPIEPTADMARAAYKAWDAFGEDATLGPTEVVAIWRAMVAAAAPEPTP